MCAQPTPAPQMRANIDFVCLDEECKATVKFNLMELEQKNGRVTCPDCRREYQFDAVFLDKLKRLRQLILAVRDAEDVLGDTNVGITTMAGEEKISYRLLLTRLNTIISLDVGGRKVDFRFRVEPLLEEGSFR